MPRSGLTALLKRRGLLTRQAAVEHVAGEPIRGSWWAHPDCHHIYDALHVFHEGSDVLQVKLIGGKVTYVHRRLWPALVRLQQERRYWPAISSEARNLLRRVRRQGRLRATGKARLELERAILVISAEEHTEAGTHEMVLVPFEAWIPADIAEEAAALTIDDALDQLTGAGYRPASQASSRHR